MTAVDPAIDIAPTRIVLVRHGESNTTVNRAIGGRRSCTGLSDLGRRQCQRLAARLGETGELAGAILYASDFARARETAEILAPSLGADGADAEVHVEAGFGEHDPGPDIDGLTYVEFVELHGTPDWESDAHAITFPGGETIADMHHRVGVALREVTTRHAGGTVVVCCHGGVVNAIVRMALRAPSVGGFELYPVNTSLTELLLVRPGRWRLVRYNDAAHLAGLPAETPRV